MKNYANRSQEKNNNGATFQIHYLSFHLQMLAESFLAEYKFKLKLSRRDKEKKKIIAKYPIRALLLTFLESSPDFPRTDASPLSTLEQILEQIVNARAQINRRYNSASSKCQNVVARRPNRDVNRSVGRLTMYPALYRSIYTPSILPPTSIK